MNSKLKSVIALAITSIMAVSSMHINAFDASSPNDYETDINASETQVLDSHYIEGDTGYDFDMDECLDSISKASVNSSMSSPERYEIQAHDEIRIYTAAQLEGINYSWTTVQGSGSPDCATIVVRSDGMYIVGLHPETEFLQVTVGSTTSYYFITIRLADTVYRIDNDTNNLRLKDTDDFYESKKAQLFTAGTSSVLYKEDLFKIIHIAGNSYCIRSMLNSSMALCRSGDSVVLKTIGTSNDSIPSEATWTIRVSSLRYGRFNISNGTGNNTLTSSSNADDESEVLLAPFTSAESYQTWVVDEYSIPTASQSSYTGVVIPNAVSQLGIGEKYTFTADIYSYLPDENGQNGFDWSVTNGTGSATIDENGLLTCVSRGTVTVTATYKNTSYSTSIVVTIGNRFEGKFSLKNNSTNQYLSIGDGSNDLKLTTTDSQTEQKWYVMLNSNGYYNIVSVDDLSYLTYGTKDKDTCVLRFGSHVSDYSEWCIIRNGDSITFVPSDIAGSKSVLCINKNDTCVLASVSTNDPNSMWTATSYPF